MTMHKTETDWREEDIQRIWNWYSANSHAQGSYFSYLCGEGIVTFLEQTGKLRGKVLDFGCGMGHLLDRFVLKGLECYGADFSQESISRVNQKLANTPHWKGGVVIHDLLTSYPDDHFDVITSIEMLEHLRSDRIPVLLAELRRILKPGGVVFITTPHAEKLEESLVYCPFCDSAFHKWQHFQTINTDKMKSLLAAADFEVLFCKNIDLEQFQTKIALPPVLEISIYHLLSWALFKMRGIMDKLFPKAFPDGWIVRYRLKAGNPRHLCSLITKPR